MVDRDRLDRLSVVATNLALDTGAREVISSLNDTEVRSLLLRGPAIAQWLYTESAPREYSDIDLLVAPSWFSVAERTLAELGFTESPLERSFAGSRPSHANTWSRSGDALTIDLHRTLAGCNASPAEVWDALCERTELLELEGISVEIPSAAARAVVVALHAGEQGILLGHPLEDLRRALGFPIELWIDASCLADRLQARDSFARGLCLLPEGAKVAERLGLGDWNEQTPEPLSGQAFRIAHGLSWGWRQQGLWRKIRFLARKVIPTQEFMKSRSSLARRGRIALIGAYAWRILRLLRFTPSAVVGQRRSRRR
jgi:putative nucleotidyltransferase-like protein